MSNYVLMHGQLVREDELYHYGIKGQKWGIRRYQNLDGTLTSAGKKHRDQIDKHTDDIVIKSGSKRSSVTTNGNLKLRGNWALNETAAALGVLAPRKRGLSETKTYVYDDKDEQDRLVYEGAFSAYLEGKRYMYKNPIFKTDYETVGDLVSPSDKRRAELFVESFKEQPKKYLNALNSARTTWQNMADMYGEDVLTEDKRRMISKVINEDSSDADLLDVGYRQFNAASERRDRPYITAQNTYYKKLKREGYNALIDDNNHKVYNNANNPLIVLDAKKRLKKTGTTQLSPEEIAKNVKKLRKRQGGRIAL